MKGEMMFRARCRSMMQRFSTERWRAGLPLGDVKALVFAIVAELLFTFVFARSATALYRCPLCKDEPISISLYFCISP